MAAAAKTGLKIIMVLALETNNDRHPIEPEEESQGWPGLLAKLVVDFTKVVEAEARLARASVEPILSAVLERWLLQIVIVTFALTGCVLLLGAAILLLHHRLQWWEAFGVVGGLTVVVAVACGRLSRR